jgi:hypothetical protein
MLELYLHSPIRLHGVMLRLIMHEENFTFSLLDLINLKSIEMHIAIGADVSLRIYIRTYYDM